jgi:chromosome segregation ATPase
LHEAGLSVRQDPALEARAHQAELEAADLARQLDEARRRHLDEKGALEADIQRLRSEALAGRLEDQLPIASESALREAQSLREAAEAETAALRQRLSQAESLADSDRASAQAAQETAAQAQQALEALKIRQAEQDKRVTALEGHALELERQFGEAQLRLAESAKPEEVAAWQARLAELEAQACWPNPVA